MWLFVVCDLYMNRVKVVGIVLKIYWYPLWLESHMSICASYTHTDTHTTALLCIVSLFSSLILTRIWIIYIPQKCVGLFDFPFPAGYTHINLSACFIFVLFFVIVYIVFFLFDILRGCIRWTTRDIYDGIHLNVQNLWDSCVITCIHSNWLPHHIGWKNNNNTNKNNNVKKTKANKLTKTHARQQLTTHQMRNQHKCKPTLIQRQPHIPSG